jgi:hypothetical protein
LKEEVSTYISDKLVQSYFKSDHPSEMNVKLVDMENNQLSTELSNLIKINEDAKLEINSQYFDFTKNYEASL